MHVSLSFAILYAFNALWYSDAVNFNDVVPSNCQYSQIPKNYYPKGAHVNRGEGIPKIAQPSSLLKKVQAILYVAKYRPSNHYVGHFFAYLKSVLDMPDAVQHVNVWKKEDPVHTVEHSRV